MGVGGGDGATLQVWDSVPFPFGSANCGKEGGQRERDSNKKRKVHASFLMLMLILIPFISRPIQSSLVQQSLSCCVVLWFLFGGGKGQERGSWSGLAWSGVGRRG